MSISQDFRDHLLHLLVPLGPVTAKRMFGGGGLFLDGLMFGLVADDVLYLKADADNQPMFEAAGAVPFIHQRGDRQIAMSYWRVPTAVFNDGQALCQWADAARQAAVRNAAAKPKRRRKKSPKAPS